MQKYIDLLALGTKLQIISAFALDHVKGYIYIESDKQCDVYEVLLFFFFFFMTFLGLELALMLLWKSDHSLLIFCSF